MTKDEITRTIKFPILALAKVVVELADSNDWQGILEVLDAVKVFQTATVDRLLAVPGFTLDDEPEHNISPCLN